MMHISGGSGGSGKDAEQDFEINIASIIDCFTVLITYLLVSTAFISIGMIDVNMATPGPSAVVDKNPDLNLRIDLGSKRLLTLILSGEKSSTLELSAKNGSWDFTGLESALKPIKDKFSQLTIAQLSAAPSTEYTDIVRAVETIRKVMPVVYFAERPGHLD